MHKSLLITAFLFNLIAFPSTSTAREAQQNFESIVFDYIEACEKQCPQQTFEKLVYKDGQPLNSFITYELLTKLSRIAIEQAYIWGDTILGGEFHAEGATELKSVSIIYNNGTPFALRIWYYENAWDVSECEFDGLNEDSLSSCTPGYIFESSYVSLDGEFALTDYNNSADFFLSFDPSHIEN